MPLGNPLLDALDRLGYGGIFLDHAGQPLRANGVAKTLLNGGGAPPNSPADPNWRAAILNSFLYSNGRLRFRVEQNGWRVVRRQDCDPSRPLILRELPIEEREPSGPQSVLVLIDLAATPRPASRSLQEIFGLTPTEARLAIAMAGGESLEEIAEVIGVTVGTFRKQLTSIFAKTDTHRQSELVALLARLSILP